MFKHCGGTVTASSVVDTVDDDVEKESSRHANEADSQSAQYVDSSHSDACSKQEYGNTEF